MATFSPSSPMAAIPVTIAARLDRLPPTRYFSRLVMLISIGGFFEFYDLFMTGYIGVGFIDAKIFKPTTAGLFDLGGFASFAGAGFLGMFVGTIGLTWISDRYGRRAAFTSALLWYSVATLIMAFMSGPFWIDFWRFIAGIGVGLQLVTINGYITEITPRVSRGRYIQLAQFIAFCGVPVVAIVARLCIGHIILGLDGWRWVAILAAAGAIPAFFLRTALPESPRWLETHGRREEAERVMQDMEEAVRRETGSEPPPPQPLPDEAVAVRTAWADMWRPPYSTRLIMLSVFNFFQAVGFYGFAAWVPILLVSEGISVTKSLTFVFVIALINPVGPLLATTFADRVERKWLIVGLALTIGLCGLIWAGQRSAAGILILGAIITLANNVFSGAYHCYQQELFPTRIRGRAVGFGYSWSRFSNIFVGFAIAAALKTWGVTGVFVLVAGAMLIVAVTIAVFGPKTNQLRLEEISH